MDGRDKVVVGSMVIVLILALSFAYSRFEKCEAKGGAYIQGQCLKVEVLK